MSEVKAESDVRVEGKIRLDFDNVTRKSTPPCKLTIKESSGKDTKVTVQVHGGNCTAGFEPDLSDQSSTGETIVPANGSVDLYVAAHSYNPTPQQPGGYIAVSDSGGTTALEAWVRPTGGHWDNNWIEDTDIVAVHAARVGDHVLAWGPRPNDLNGEGKPPKRDKNNKLIWDHETLHDPAKLDRVLLDVGTKRLSVVPMKPVRNHFCSGHAHMANGDLFIAGGHTPFLGENRKGNPKSAASQAMSIYSTLDGKFTSDAGPRVSLKSRWCPTAITLPSGEILIAFGNSRALSFIDPKMDDGPNGYWRKGNNDFEIYSPSQQTVRGPFPNFLSTKGYPDDGNGPAYPHIYALPGDERTYLLTIAGNHAFLHRLDVEDETAPAKQVNSHKVQEGWVTYPHYGSSAPLCFKDGARKIKIVLAGGQHEDQTEPKELSDKTPASKQVHLVEVDFSNGKSSLSSRVVGSLPEPTILNSATLLPDGNVVISGGAQSGTGNWNQGTNYNTTMFDTSQEVLRPLAKAGTGRKYHSSALALGDGSVLMWGSHGGFGADEEGNSRWDPNLSASRYYPSYLYRHRQPKIENVEKTESAEELKLVHGQTFHLTVSGEDIGTEPKLVLLRHGSVTHGFNMDQRGVELQFVHDKESGTFEVTCPKSAAMLPPGPYDLFFLSSDGVPSMGRTVQVKAEQESH